MGKYSGLDKADLERIEFVESYCGGKIYLDDGRFLAAKRGYVIDSDFNDISGAKAAIDYFNSA